MTTLDQRLRAACDEKCEGDVPCYVLDARANTLFKPCDDCLRDCGEEPAPPPLDPDAVVRPLL